MLTIILFVVSVLGFAFIVAIGMAIKGHQIHRQQRNYEAEYQRAHERYRDMLEAKRVAANRRVIPPPIQVQMAFHGDGTVKETTPH